MHITIDLSPVVHHKAGLATYARQLTQHLLCIDQANGYSAFHYGQLNSSLDAPLDALPRRSVPWGARRWRLNVAANYFIGGSMDRMMGNADLFHATEHLLPPFRTTRTVFTFHDAIYELFPDYHLPLNQLFLGLMMPRFLRRADAIIAVSECSKRDAVRLYGIPSEKIIVIYEGANPALRPIDNLNRIAEGRARYSRHQPFLLFLGTIEPRKNISALVDAVQELHRRGFSHRLLIAGRKGWLYQPTIDHVRQAGMEPHVDFLNFVPDDDLPALFAGCDAFVFPSLYEGFGLPPLEAMACGAPVICSNTSSLPEVVGDAALLVNPRDVNEIANAIERIVTHRALRDELCAKGITQAAKFSWVRAACETLAVYEHVMEQHT